MNLRKIIKEELDWISNMPVGIKDVRLGDKFYNSIFEFEVVDVENGYVITKVTKVLNPEYTDQSHTTHMTHHRSVNRLIDQGAWKRLNESVELDWIDDSTPNWSDWYLHLYDKITTKFPESLSDVEEFASGSLMPIIFKIDVLNRKLKEFLKENEYTSTQDLKWDLIGFHNAVTNMVKAIRNRDDGKEMYDHVHDNETIYTVNRSHLDTLFSDNKDSIPNILRSLGL